MNISRNVSGWVRSVAVEPGNEWFCTGAADRVIKIWDLASGKLKLSLTGHVSTVRGLVVSPRQPYLFSCGEDRQVNYELENVKVIGQNFPRNYNFFPSWNSYHFSYFFEIFV